MKKSTILSIAGAVICALAACISCSKIDNVAEPESEPETEPEAPIEIILHATVANPAGDEGGSKSSFSGNNWVWEGGDIISVWYDSNTGSTPDALMGYNAKTGEWSFTQLQSLSGNKPSTKGGTLKVVYRHGDIGIGTANANELTLTATCDYTYSVIDNKGHLYCNLENWTYLSEIRVIRSDLDGGDASNYTLACDQFYPITGYEVGESGVTATLGTKGAAVQGIAYSGGGVAFVFATAAYSSNKQTFSFTLQNSGSTNHFSGYMQKSKSLSKITNCAELRSITLTGNWTQTSGVTDGHSWTQLWENGPKWADFNVGSTINSYLDLVYYYDVQAYAAPWRSGTEVYYDAHYHNIDNVGGLYIWHNSNQELRTSTIYYGWQSDNRTYKHATLGIKDVATSVWGSNWREPTYEEFQNLIDKCVRKFTSYAWNYGHYYPDPLRPTEYCQALAGYVFSGAVGTVFEKNHIFLPFAGRYVENYALSDREGGIEHVNEYGEYWTSDLYPSGTNVAYQLVMQYGNKPGLAEVWDDEWALSVRAVLK